MTLPRSVANARYNLFSNAQARDLALSANSAKVAPMEFREHRISANGLTHFIRDSGSENAPAALLLHGFPDSSAIWDFLTPILVEKGYRIIAPDLRGFGQSDMAARKKDYDLNTGSIPDMVELMRALDVERAHLVGHDFGAPVAWGLARDTLIFFALLPRYPPVMCAPI